MRLSLIILCVCSGTLALAQPTDTLARIDQLFYSFNNATPGVAVAVARGDKAIYEKAFGLADLEHNVPATPQTVFESGSVAKQFTAMAVLMLAKDGKVSLTDDVRKYIPELPVYEAPVRIQHLLNHTSGLKDWGSIGSITGWPRTTRVYTQALALQIMSRQKTLNNPPGDEYLYSNANYSCLVTIVERVSGKSLADFTEEKFFKPLGMTNTRWRDNFREVVPNRAIAYSGGRDGYQQNMPFENIHGHGGLLTTVGDLIKWNQLLETHSIGGDEVYNWRVQNGKLNNGKTINYAAGLNVGHYRDVPEIAHSGATAGYRAWLAYYPKQKLTVVVLSNHAGANAPGLGHKIADIYLGSSAAATSPERKAIELTEVQVKNWTGTYRYNNGFDVLKLEARGNKLFNGDTELKAFHADTLSMWNGRLTRHTSGALIWKDNNVEFRYDRVMPFAGDLNNYTGTFTSVEADDVWTMAVRDGKLVALHGAFDPIELTPVFKDAFQIDHYDLVEFKRDKSGKVTGFELSISRAERIPFSKNKK